MKTYRPSNLNEVIGNDKIKEAITVALNASIKNNNAFPHTLFYGAPGTGKTLLSSIVAKERGGDFKPYLSNVFQTRHDVQNLMTELNFENYEDADLDDPQADGAGFKITGTIKPTVIFLDEIHQISRKIQECFFQAMETNEFTIEKRNSLNGKLEKGIFWVPKFTLIGTTTRPGDLDKAFMERFKLLFTLNPYTEKELFSILYNYSKKLDLDITNEALFNIAKRSRGIARKAINFLERVRDTQVYFGSKDIDNSIVEKTFELLNVDQKGLDDLDIQLLKYLYEIYPQKIGVNRLASVLNVTEDIIKGVIEPYLLRERFLDATPSGRIISEKGMNYLEKTGLIVKNETSEKLSRRVNNV